MDEYVKDFDSWGEEKKRIEAFGYHKPCKEGEIWWCILACSSIYEKSLENYSSDFSSIPLRGRHELHILLPL